MAERPSTPPRPVQPLNPLKSPLTPEQVRRLEEARLKAKSLRQQHEATAKAASQQQSDSTHAPSSSRDPSHHPTRASTSTHRDARNSPGQPGQPGQKRPHDDIEPARKFAKYVDYDFSKMTDTKGGFLTADDDPHNRAMRAPADAEPKPANMSVQEWERHRLLKKLREARSGPFQPGLSVLGPGTKAQPQCRDCDSLDIDYAWLDVFGVAVCTACKERDPDQYSLLTKTEAREDYLLTEPELRDPALLPHLEKPNPHKSTWNNMMLFLRCQVEAYAFSDQKWGSPAALDAEFAKRQAEKKRRKEEKFRGKLAELKKRTRVEKERRRRDGEGTGEFGERIRGRHDTHQHEWGRVLQGAAGPVRKCVECGMEVEEVEF